MCRQEDGEWQRHRSQSLRLQEGKHSTRRLRRPIPAHSSHIGDRRYPRRRDARCASRASPTKAAPSRPRASGALAAPRRAAIGRQPLQPGRRHRSRSCRPTRSYLFAAERSRPTPSTVKGQRRCRPRSVYAGNSCPSPSTNSDRYVCPRPRFHMLWSVADQPGDPRGPFERFLKARVAGQLSELSGPAADDIGPKPDVPDVAGGIAVGGDKACVWR